MCLCVEFNATFNNFSVISWQCMVVAGSSMLILNSAASLKYHAPDTRHGTTLIHIILKRGRPVLALPKKSASSTSSNLWHPVPWSRGYTEDGKKRYAYLGFPAAWKRGRGAFRKRAHCARWVIRKGHILCSRAIRKRQKGYFQCNVEKH